MEYVCADVREAAPLTCEFDNFKWVSSFSRFNFCFLNFQEMTEKCKEMKFIIIISRKN